MAQSSLQNTCLGSTTTDNPLRVPINITCTGFYRHTKSHTSFFLDFDSHLDIQLQVCTFGMSLSHYFSPLFFVLVFGCNLIFTVLFRLQNSF
jgi:hypothetical protein